jgi:hypothetical protein
VAATEVAMDPAGDVVAVWERSNGTHRMIQAASRPPEPVPAAETAGPVAGLWKAPGENISEALQEADEPQIAMDPAGDAMAVWQRTSGANFIIQAAFRRGLGGGWQAPLELSEAGGNAYVPRVAMDSKGDALATWVRSNGVNEIVQSAFRPAGGSWLAPVNVSPPGVSARDQHMAMDAQGDAVSVWHSTSAGHEVIYAAYQPAGGSWQPGVGISAGGEDAVLPQVAIDPHGNAVAIWSRSNGTNNIIQAAFKPAAGAWLPAVNVSEEGQNAYSPDVAMDAAGNAVAVWERSNGSGFVAQSAFLPAFGAWQPAVNLSGPGSELEARVAMNPEGDAVAAWDNRTATTETIQGAVRPSGAGAWQSVANVSEPAPNASQGHVAIDSRGDAVAIWNRTNGANFIAQAALYDLGPTLHGVSIPGTGTVGQQLNFSVSRLEDFAALQPSTWSFGDGSRASGTSVVHTYTATGRYAVTLATTDVFGIATSAAGVVTITPAAPTITGLRESASRWREGSKLAKISASGHGNRKKKPPVGTTFSFSLNEPAAVTFSFTKKVGGRRVGHKCVAKTPKNAKHKACKRTVTVATMSFEGHAGSNQVVFQGTFSRAHKLARGRYTLVVTAIDSLHHTSAPRTLVFTIVK